MKRLFIPLFLALAIVARAETKKAVAVLQPTKGSTVSGTVTFTKVEGGVQVVAEVTGLTPGDHGFHVHEFGDCSDPEAKSAGGHFNPAGHQHGAPDGEVRHAGDLGNLTADATGKAHYSRLDKHLMLDGDHSIMGHSVIVHEKVDDLKTQPTGNAGARVACGSIGIAKP
ncbi:MAG: superoxide dismutase family protein [Verrucomicrobiota bacterium]